MIGWVQGIGVELEENIKNKTTIKDEQDTRGDLKVTSSGL